MIDVPQTLHWQRERGRVVAQGHSTDDGRRCTANGTQFMITAMIKP